MYLVYVMCNFYNQKLRYGVSKNVETLKDELSTNKRFNPKGKNTYSKVVYIEALQSEKIAKDTVEHMKLQKRYWIDNLITNLNPDWSDLI